jgi:hypothetical protein
MKQPIFFIPLLASLFIFSEISAQGKYAGTMKKIIGSTYTDSRNIAVLNGWQFVEGSVVNPLNDPETITVDVFQKGTTWIVFFSIKEDTAAATYKIMDIIEVKAVMKGWQIRSGFCRSNKNENPEIVALVKKSTVVEYLKPAKKAWRFNRDKRRFEIISTAGIDCINQALD